MAITITCASCGEQYRVKDALAGKTVTCKKCENGITVVSDNLGDEEFFDFVDNVVKDESKSRASGSGSAKAIRERKVARDTKGEKSGSLDASVGDLTPAGWLLLLAVGALKFLVVLLLMWGNRVGGPFIALITILVAAAGFGGAKYCLNAYGVAVLKRDRDQKANAEAGTRMARPAMAIGVIPIVILVLWIAARLWLANSSVPHHQDAKRMEMLEKAEEAERLMKDLERSGVRFDEN